MGCQTATGWIQCSLEQWFRNHFLVHASSIRPLLLLLDGHLSHYSPTFLKMAAEESIIVFCLPPHTTHLLQLLDNGVFASLKGQWRYECQRFYAQNPGKVLNQCNFMQVFHKAWVQGMTIANVTSCFRAVGVYPVDKSAAMSHLDTSNSPSRSTGVPYVPFCTPRKGTAQPTPAQAHSPQAIMFSPGEVGGFQERLREDKASRYALWLETFYPTNPKASSMSQGVLATILQLPMPPAQRKVHTRQQGASVLTSELCIQQLEEKEAKKKEKQEEKERRKAKRERKRQEKAEASKVKKAAKNKGTAQSSKTACSAYTYIPSHSHTILLFMQKHDKLSPNSWSPALHCVSRTNSQHVCSPRQRCAGTNGDRRKGMIYQIFGIRCGWRTLVAGLQQWQQVMATQSTPAAREGSVIT